MPNISVLMPVHNAENFLSAAIESILNQTERDFELLLLDDGSSDASVDIAERYAEQDCRVTPIHWEHRGLIATLNEGIRLVNSPFIARMDADDLCSPTRFEKQIRFLRAHPSHAVVGTAIRYIDDADNFGKKATPECRPSAMRTALLFGSPIFHATIMLNRERVNDAFYYDPSYVAAEDFELWCRLARSYELSSIKEALYFYRVHPDCTSVQRKREQLTNCFRALRNDPFVQEFEAAGGNIEHLFRVNREGIRLTQFLRSTSILLETHPKLHGFSNLTLFKYLLNSSLMIFLRRRDPHLAG